jgi:hypothetical protein
MCFAASKCIAASRLKMRREGAIDRKVPPDIDLPFMAWHLHLEHPSDQRRSGFIARFQRQPVTGFLDNGVP